MFAIHISYLKLANRISPENPVNFATLFCNELPTYNNVKQQLKAAVICNVFISEPKSQRQAVNFRRAGSPAVEFIKAGDPFRLALKTPV
jgi:hypothetical protein